MGKFKGVGVNPELPLVLTITFLLFLIGFLLLFFRGNPDFNFYSSKIVIDGQNITEELHFKPDKDYHTLYRNFENKIYFFHHANIYSKNYFLIKSVDCSHGIIILKIMMVFLILNHTLTLKIMNMVALLDMILVF